MLHVTCTWKQMCWRKLEKNVKQHQTVFGLRGLTLHYKAWVHTSLLLTTFLKVTGVTVPLQPYSIRQTWPLVTLATSRLHYFMFQVVFLCNRFQLLIWSTHIVTKRQIKDTLQEYSYDKFVENPMIKCKHIIKVPTLWLKCLWSIR